MRLQESNRFTTLKILHSDHKMQNYITCIKNPDIREIYTRLRIDMNILSSSRSRGLQQHEFCPFCNEESESVSHFLLKCKRYDYIRNDFFDCLQKRNLLESFSIMSDNDKLKYLLSVGCPTEVIGECCKFIHKIYKLRENVMPIPAH